jgi:hypothetical protein
VLQQILKAIKGGKGGGGGGGGHKATMPINAALKEARTPRVQIDFVWPVYALISARPGAGSNSTAPASRG